MQKIIITNSSYKKKILKEYVGKLCPYKFYTWQEFLEKFYFSYRSDTLYYVTKKYKIDPSIAAMYLQNLYFIDEKQYSSSKLNDLVSLKKDLEENGYLKKDFAFPLFIQNCPVVFFEILFTPFHDKVKKELEKITQVEVKYEERKNKEITFTTYKTVEEEVIGVAERITDLLEKGVDINTIKIGVPNREYYTSIEKIFSLFSIPYALQNRTSLYSLEVTSAFLKGLDQEKTLEELMPYLKQYQDTPIFDPILQIFIAFSWQKILMKDFYETFIYLLKTTKAPSMHYKNCIQEVEIKQYAFDQEFLFLLGAAMGHFPTIIEDNAYLNEEEMILLGLGSISVQNQREEENVLSVLGKIAHLSISFSPTSYFTKYSKPTFLDKVKNRYSVVENTGDYHYTNEKINLLYLGKFLDSYDKFSQKNPMLSSLLEKYGNTAYRMYDNRFTGLDPTDLYPFIEGKLNLSYSNMDTFFKCAFQFYVDSVLKLKPFEETVSTKIGKIFHKVLEIVYREERKDYECVIDTVLEEFNKEQILTKRDEFYQKKYKEALLLLLSLLEEQRKNTNYQNQYFEEYFSIQKDADLKISLVGFIDKILTFEDEKNTYVVVIDYKTGTLHNDFTKVIYGMDMQLLIYLYLIKNTSKIKNPKFTGMYLQPILSEVLKSEKNKSYMDLLRDKFRLDGYTNTNLEQLKNWDTQYQDKSFIKSLRVKSDGDFYQYSKVLTEEEINQLLDIVGEKIEHVLSSIRTGFFPINPKRMDKENIGCAYCPYIDLCYRKPNDFIDLEHHKKINFLGGDRSDTTKAH